MNGSLNQQQLLTNSVIQITDAAINEETPLTDQQFDAVDELQSSTPTGLEWNTSLVSEVRESTLFSNRLSLFGIDLS